MQRNVPRDDSLDAKKKQERIVARRGGTKRLKSALRPSARPAEQDDESDSDVERDNAFTNSMHSFVLRTIGCLEDPSKVGRWPRRIVILVITLVLYAMVGFNIYICVNENLSPSERWQFAGNAVASLCGVLYPFFVYRYFTVTDGDGLVSEVLKKIAPFVPNLLIIERFIFGDGALESSVAVRKKKKKKPTTSGNGNSNNNNYSSGGGSTNEAERNRYRTLVEKAVLFRATDQTSLYERFYKIIGGYMTLCILYLYVRNREALPDAPYLENGHIFGSLILSLVYTAGLLVQVWVLVVVVAILVLVCHALRVLQRSVISSINEGQPLKKVARRYARLSRMMNEHASHWIAYLVWLVFFLTIGMLCHVIGFVNISYDSTDEQVNRTRALRGGFDLMMAAFFGLIAYSLVAHPASVTLYLRRLKQVARAQAVEEWSTKLLVEALDDNERERATKAFRERAHLIYDTREQTEDRVVWMELSYSDTIKLMNEYMRLGIYAIVDEEEKLHAELQLKADIATFDTNANGMIELDEWLELCVLYKRNSERVKSAFNAQSKAKPYRYHMLDVDVLISADQTTGHEVLSEATKHNESLFKKHPELEGVDGTMTLAHDGPYRYMIMDVDVEDLLRHSETAIVLSQGGSNSGTAGAETLAAELLISPDMKHLLEMIDKPGTQGFSSGMYVIDFSIVGHLLALFILIFSVSLRVLSFGNLLSVINSARQLQQESD